MRLAARQPLLLGQRRSRHAPAPSRSARAELRGASDGAGWVLGSIQSPLPALPPASAPKSLPPGSGGLQQMDRAAAMDIVQGAALGKPAESAGLPNAEGVKLPALSASPRRTLRVRGV